MNNTIIFYDGLCKLCLNQKKHYQKYEKNYLHWVDIHSQEFQQYETLISKKNAVKEIHSLSNNILSSNVEAIAIIWTNCYYYEYLSFLLILPILNLIAKFGYKIIAKYRYFFGKNNCTDYCQK